MYINKVRRLGRPYTLRTKKKILGRVHDRTLNSDVK